MHTFHNLFVPIFLLVFTKTFAQTGCGCDACSFFITNGFDGKYRVRIDSADQNSLADPAQNLVAVHLKFNHTQVGDLEFSLVSPAGQVVRLVSPSGANTTTLFSNWDIRFLPCGEIAQPDPGHFANWGDNFDWGTGGNFTGKYHPADGCLENFNLGPVVGDWVLKIKDNGNSGNWNGFLIGFHLEFSQPAGISCTPNPPHPAPGDDCSTAPIFENLDGYSGSTAGFQPNPNILGCGTLENDSWLGFVAASNSVTFVSKSGNCQVGNGIQLAVFPDCAAPPIACSPGQPSGAGLTNVLTANNLTIGNTYFLMVDGFSGDVCDFTLEVVPDKFGDLAKPAIPQGPASVCNGGSAVYSIPKTFGSNGYFWKINGAGVFSNQTQNLETYGNLPEPVQVLWGIGGGEVCVAARNLEDTTTFSSLQISTPQSVAVNLPAKYLCQSELPWLPPFPHVPILESGIYSATVSAANGCDSMFSISVFVASEPADVFFPPVILINNQCFSLPTGQQICDAGSQIFVQNNASGCPTNYHFDITKIHFSPIQFACAPVSVPFLVEGPAGADLVFQFPGADSVVFSGNNPEVFYTHAGNFGFFVTSGAVTIPYPNQFKIGDAPDAEFSIFQNNQTFTFSDASTGDVGQFFWDFGDGTTASGANQVHDFAVPGSYPVTFICSNPCGSDTIIKTVEWISATGETGHFSPKITVYPNPIFDGNFTVLIENSVEKEVKIEIFNTVGQLVFIKNFNCADPENCKILIEKNDLPPGVFDLKIQTPSWRANRKIICLK